MTDHQDLLPWCLRCRRHHWVDSKIGREHVAHRGVDEHRARLAHQDRMLAIEARRG